MSQTVHEYQGYQMRSHSETRWAGMMDALRISWIYEPALVKTRHGMYLPDFYLPYAGIYLEVKGPRPNEIEIEKARDLQSATGIRVVFAYGDMFTEGAHGVQGGFFLTVSDNGNARYSTYEFGPYIRAFVGEEEWKRYMRAGFKHAAPSCSMIGDVLRDYLISKMDRSAREQQMARIHKGLNEQKAQQYVPISPIEAGLRFFFTRNAVSKEAA